ncbi:MAG: UDP-glucose 4-epimerase GalE [Bacillota bacterium]
MSVLVTGGLGYIGSHTAVELIKSGEKVVICDNLSNSKEACLDRIETIAGARPTFYKMDVRDEEALSEVFEKEDITSIIHFAGLKAVGESVKVPLKYYENNIVSTISLVKTMKKHGVKNLVFSSSATVYGFPETCPISEDFPLACYSPYGRTKLFIEDILRDEAVATPDLNIALLRYFNPIGAHESGLIGEDPQGIPNNLMPYITQVAIGKLEKLSIYGNDYNTPDGTCVRDYIHVCDLAVGHVLAIKKLEENCGVVTYNLGTGEGYSVLDIVHAFEKALGNPLPHVFVGRRAGDVETCYANPEKAEKELGFKAQYSIDDMCSSSWHWQSKNPNGFDD